MKVLYVNQTAVMSGAERSLLTVLDSWDGRVEAQVACPNGPLAEAARGRGLRVHTITGTDASFRLHPVHTPRALGEIGAAAASVARVVAREGFDVVHANTARAGLIVAATPRRGAPRVILHVRDWLPEGRKAALVLGFAARRAEAIIANSRWIAGQLPVDAARVHTLRNPVDLDRFDPRALDRGHARAALGLGEQDIVLGVVGQLTPWKGQADAVHALSLLKRSKSGAKLLIAGSAKFASRSTRFDNRRYAEALMRLPAELGVEDDVSFLGERDDVEVVMSALDVLLVPSWREAFGRVVAEGMAMGLPVVATSVGGPAEIVRDGVDGVLLAPRDPDAWAGALERLLADRDARLGLGASARARARVLFDPEAHAASLLNVYREVHDRGEGQRSDASERFRAAS